MRVLSGVQPTGQVHLGNYLGAFRHWVDDQATADSLYCIVDLHALTVEHDRSRLAASTLELAITLLAVGLDPENCTLFAQSHVPQHTSLAWLLECTSSMGELRRMTQFKEKSKGKESVSVGLFTYPVLMAADILVYDTDRVPVGDDQRQHLELARDLALRFNARYGQTFTVPEATIPKVGARVMDLQNPTAKMSKSSPSPSGTIGVLEAPESIEKKVRRAVTDSDNEVRYDPSAKPGVSNLLELIAASTHEQPAKVAERYTTYGPLKADAAAAVIDMLSPIKGRYDEIASDPGAVRQVLRKGSAKARGLAQEVLDRASRAVGLLEP